MLVLSLVNMMERQFPKSYFDVPSWRLKPATRFTSSNTQATLQEERRSQEQFWDIIATEPSHKGAQNQTSSSSCPERRLPESHPEERKAQADARRYLR